ncbi:MAG: LTA synthase family protein [Eubacteriales bacterium]|nr:LTA synthase family protein [Eubacteriales bacterium]
MWKFLNRISLILQALGSALLYFVIEAISRHSFAEAWTFMVDKPIVFAYNASFIFVSLLVVYLFRRRCFLRVLIGSIWLFLGALNGILLCSRVTPFTGPDLKLLSDAMAIVNKYMTPETGILAGIILAALLIFLLWLLIKGPKYKGKIKYRYSLLLLIVGVALFAGSTELLLEKRILSTYFGNIAFAYEDYGYPYCLATTIFNTGISCPMDYSEETISKIEKSESDLPKTNDESRPNIIFIQLESFFDPTLVNYLKLSEDPIPYFRQLMKDYSSGYYKVPSVGAGTANTEFESITGMSMRYFGPGEYPYKGILKEATCESTPYVLKELGYTTAAIHNNEANFYGRRSVFANLGFDYFISAEYMPGENDKNPLGWVRDRVLTDEIMKCLNNSEGPDYIYTISVQGHGNYPEEKLIENPEITVSGAPTEAMNNKWEYYVNQIHEMDLFVKSLTEALEDYPEDVVLVLYGDHLPTMDLKVENLKNKYLFQTEYVIWDNFGMKKKDDNLAAYQIAAEVLDRVGIHEGTILRYHQARRNTKNYQVDLETLQYDVLYGEKYSYDGKSPFEHKKVKLGLYEVRLDSLSKIPGADDIYLLKGENFTPSTEIQLNGEWYETIYIDEETLMITGVVLDDFDIIKICQRSNSSTRKALSKGYDRAVYALYDSDWKIKNTSENK